MHRSGGGTPVELALSHDPDSNHLRVAGLLPNSYHPAGVGSTVLHRSDRGQLQYRPENPPAVRSATLRNEQFGTAHP